MPDNVCVHKRKPDGSPTGRPMYSGNEPGAAAFIRGQNVPDDFVKITAAESAAVIAAES